MEPKDITPLPDINVPGGHAYHMHRRATGKAIVYGDTKYRGETRAYYVGKETIVLLDYSVTSWWNMHARRSMMILHQRSPNEVVAFVTERLWLKDKYIVQHRLAALWQTVTNNACSLIFDTAVLAAAKPLPAKGHFIKQECFPYADIAQVHTVE